jgi:nitroreductase
MKVEEAIKGRRSIREYEKKDIPQELIDKILKAAAMAPSAMDRQPCRFIVITNKEKIKELSGKVKDKAGVLGLGARFIERMKISEDVIFYQAPLLIFIVAGKNKRAATDCSLATQNMFLQAYELGIGSCFIGFADLLADDRETLRDLGIKDSQELFCSLIFGYPKKWPKPKDREAKIQKEIK